MAVLKQTSPTAWPSAPRPKPSITVTSASTRSAVGLWSGQAEASSVVVMMPLHSRSQARRQSGGITDSHAFDTGFAARKVENRRFLRAGARHWLSRCREPPRSFVSQAQEDGTMLRDAINNAVKDAMKAKEERKLSTLRMVNSTIKNADIAARGEGKPPLSDADLLGVFQKMIKQRQESVELYEKGGRAELAAQEREEIAVISAYLPKQMSDDDMKAAIAAAIKETGAAGMKDMGKVVGVLKGKYAGQMDFGKASGLVKAALTG